MRPDGGKARSTVEWERNKLRKSCWTLEKMSQMILQILTSLLQLSWSTTLQSWIFASAGVPTFPREERKEISAFCLFCVELSESEKYYWGERHPAPGKTTSGMS